MGQSWLEQFLRACADYPRPVAARGERRFRRGLRLNTDTLLLPNREPSTSSPWAGIPFVVVGSILTIVNLATWIGRPNGGGPERHVAHLVMGVVALIFLAIGLHLLLRVDRIVLDLRRRRYRRICGYRHDADVIEGPFDDIAGVRVWRGERPFPSGRTTVQRLVVRVALVWRDVRRRPFEVGYRPNEGDGMPIVSTCVAAATDYHAWIAAFAEELAKMLGVPVEDLTDAERVVPVAHPAGVAPAEWPNGPDPSPAAHPPGVAPAPDRTITSSGAAGAGGLIGTAAASSLTPPNDVRVQVTRDGNGFTFRLPPATVRAKVGALAMSTPVALFGGFVLGWVGAMLIGLVRALATGDRFNPPLAAGIVIGVAAALTILFLRCHGAWSRAVLCVADGRLAGTVTRLEKICERIDVPLDWIDRVYVDEDAVVIVQSPRPAPELGGPDALDYAAPLEGLRPIRLGGWLTAAEREWFAAALRGALSLAVTGSAGEGEDG